MDVGSVLNAALVRAFIISVLTGLGAGLAALQTGLDDRAAFLSGMSTFVAAFLARMSEGIYDSNRARTGDIQKSDIGAQAVTKVISGTGDGEK